MEWFQMRKKRIRDGSGPAAGRLEDKGVSTYHELSQQGHSFSCLSELLRFWAEKAPLAVALEGPGGNASSPTATSMTASASWPLRLEKQASGAATALPLYCPTAPKWLSFSLLWRSLLRPPL